jgi:protein-S-isoprenylcysteine O-methyltransferase Ste14
VLETNEVVLILALCLAAVMGVLIAGAGGLVVWLVMRARGRSDAVTVLCDLLRRTMNAALLNREEQLMRIQAEEDAMKAAFEAAKESSPQKRGSFPISPGYASAPIGQVT